MLRDVSLKENRAQQGGAMHAATVEKTPDRPDLPEYGHGLFVLLDRVVAIDNKAELKTQQGREIDESVG